MRTEAREAMQEADADALCQRAQRLALTYVANQVRQAIAVAEEKMTAARSRAHVDGAAYAFGQIAAYKIVLDMLND